MSIPSRVVKYLFEYLNLSDGRVSSILIVMNTEPTPAADSLACVFKALGDPSRLRIVEILRTREGEVTGTQLAAQAEISLALLCYHADTLVDAGIVKKRKEGQTSYWTLDREALGAALRRLSP